MRLPRRRLLVATGVFAVALALVVVLVSRQSGGSSCTLPIGGTSRGLGGFLTYPGGSYAPDAASESFYDAKHARWSNERPILSPDARYALREDHLKSAPPTTRLVAVEVASGREQALGDIGNGSSVAWLQSGIYYVTRNELLVLDPSTGSHRVVAGPTNATGLELFAALTAYNEGAVWSMTVSGGSGANGDVLVRLDLSSGKAEAWLGADGTKYFQLLGFASDGDPLVAISVGDHRQLALLTGPERSVPVEAEAFRAQGPVPFGVTDQHGLWLLSEDGGIWLLKDRVMKRVGAAPKPPDADTDVNPPALTLAGPCS